MPETGYALGDAASDLQAAGLLAHALVATGEGWRRAQPADLPGAFLDAVLDSRQASPGSLFVALRGEHQDGRAYVPQALAAGATALTERREDDPPLAAHGVVLVSDRPRDALAHLAARWRARMPARIVGVTGSNGKTTTKDLLAAALGGAGTVHATARNLNNDLGVPLTLLGLRRDHRFAVVEMGASAVGEIAALGALVRPHVGVITNAAPAHLAQFGSLAGVIQGKGEMLDVLPADGIAVLNHDSPGFADWRRRAHGRVVVFGHEQGDHHWAWRPGDGDPAGWLDLDGEAWPVRLPGEHNGANLTAAILAARAAGATDGEIRAGLAAFAPSPHRSLVLRLGGRTVLDDCYNANPESMRAAARALVSLLGGVAWAVVGAMGELGPRSDALHRETGRALRDLGIARLVAVGEGARPLAEGFDAGGPGAEYCATAEAAATRLEAATRPGDRILVKGSRAAAMEKVLDALMALWPSAK